VVRRAIAQLEKDLRFAATQKALKESQKQLVVVSERERVRFGAELHDGLGQQLTAIELRCQSMKEDIPPDRVDLKNQISEISQFLREAIAQTRALARGLSPVNLGSGGLLEALGELAMRMSRDGQIKCIFDCSVPVFVEGNLAQGHLFRIAQEAVNNAVKHSGAGEVVVRLTKGDGAVRLDISDNGRGFPKSPSNRGIGLQIMRHRASVIGAELEIKSENGAGVTVSCILKTKE
jgi:signal transduction histidine kinase